jgi:hypothetical protein
MIFPVEGMITSKPGYSPVAVDNRTPSGTAPFGSLHDSGIDTVKVSDGDGEEADTE